MAIINNLFDSGSGQLNKVVYYKVGGQGRVRSLPAEYKDKQSPAQMAQRQRMKKVLEFLTPFSKLLRITFAAEAKGRSALQAAQSYNMLNALAGEYPDIYVDKSRALLSRGPLPVPLSATVTEVPEGLLIEWEKDAEAARRNPHDTIVIMAKPADSGYGDFRFTDTRRSDGRYLWKPAFTDKAVDVWIAFRNQGQTEMSNSIYVGNV